jgi:hypothetical protein
VESQSAWEAWLEQNHAKSKGVWLQIAKKGQGVTSVSYAEAVESGLCYGWIDGQKKSFDETFYLQRFTPRRPKSIWSQINVDKVSQLIESGRMKPAGLAEVEQAQADGRWQAAYAPKALLKYRLICKLRWMLIPRPRPSLISSTKSIAMPFASASRPPKSQKPAALVSKNSSL